MYMRFLQLNIESGYQTMLHQFYEKVVIPELQAVPGCRFASLIQSRQRADDFFSMTLWDTRENAEAYNKSEIYKTLLEMVKPMLAESTEWKVNLSESLELQYQPAAEVPVLKEYTVREKGAPSHEIPAQNQQLFVRIFSIKIQKGKSEEGLQIYRRDILPVLLNTPGCRSAFLVESFQNPEDVVSVTMWDSREDAENYEKSGLFAELVEKVAHILSPLFQWKMDLARSYSRPVKTSDDGRLDSYFMVTGKQF